MLYLSIKNNRTYVEYKPLDRFFDVLIIYDSTTNTETNRLFIPNGAKDELMTKLLKNDSSVTTILLDDIYKGMKIKESFNIVKLSTKKSTVVSINGYADVPASEGGTSMTAFTITIKNCKITEWKQANIVTKQGEVKYSLIDKVRVFGKALRKDIKKRR